MFSIEAVSKEKAVELVYQDMGKKINDTLEFSHTMDEEYWTVDEDKS